MTLHEHVRPLKEPKTLRNHMDVTGRVPAALHGGLRDDGLGVRISFRHYLQSMFLRDDHLAGLQSFDHPRRIKYRAPATTRAIAMALENPGHSICGMSALAVYGLEFFADQCDTTLFGPVKQKRLATPLSPHVQRQPPGTQWTVFYLDNHLRISQPHDAVIEALSHIRSGLHAWDVHPIDSFTPTEVRAIQLIDASRRHLNISLEAILQAGHGKIHNRWLHRVCTASSHRAESPKETEMRLLCRRMCDDLGVELAEQVPVIENERIITTFDLGIRPLKIGLMYDGRQHWDRKQRDRDARINLKVIALGWLPLRVSTGTLHEIGLHLGRAVASRTNPPVQNLTWPK